MSSLDLTYAQSDKTTVHAGFWIRAFAKVVDGALLVVCFIPLDIFLGTSFVFHRGGSEANSTEMAALLIVFCLYSSLMESSRWQATVGKRMAGIVVEDLEGQRITFPRALCRSAVQVVAIGYFLAAFTSSKQALHDLAADTLVVSGTL